MDDTFLQDEEPTFDKTTLEIKNENNKFLDFQDVKDNKETLDCSSKEGAAANVPSIPFTRLVSHTFFSDRNEVVEKAFADCQRDLLTDEDELLGTWLLTEISLWDTEKERLVLLTKNSLYSVKYDLISLRILEHNRVTLSEVDTLIAGELVYPPTSFLPCLNGLADSASSLINRDFHQKWSFTSVSRTTQLEPRGRKMFGVRLMWNKGQPLSVDKKWNPFAKNIPWLTFTSHPLYWHKGLDSEKKNYDVHALHTALCDLLPDHSQKIENPIITESYVGIGSFLHNCTGLGFFKIRGKVSF